MNIKNRAVVFDAQSMRFEEWNGHLRVAETNLTKANVCEYWGWEIANNAKYGFQKDKKYRFLRSPDALKKAVKSFAERPILYLHKAADADKLDNAKVIGTTGSDPSFDFPYIKDAITIWDGDYIEAIKNNTQAELSASYAFTPVVESGVFEGEAYDAIMTDIHVDHIALVEQGRAGPDVRVADSKIIHEGKVMVKFNKTGSAVFDAVAEIVGDGRANDSKANILTNISDVVKKANRSQKEGLAKAVVGLCQGYGLIRANDEDTAGRLEETVKKAMDEDTDCKAKDSGDPVDTLEADDGDGDDKKTSTACDADWERKEDESIEAYAKRLKEGIDDLSDANKGDKNKSPEQKELDKRDKKIEKEASAVNSNIEKNAEKVKRDEDRANDAVAKALDRYKQQARETREAEKIIRPLVGELSTVFDSASGYYEAAIQLVTGTNPPKGTPVASLKFMVENLTAQKQQQSRASDSRTPSISEKERFGATRLGSF